MNIPSGSGGEIDLEVFRQIFVEDMALLSEDEARSTTLLERFDSMPLNARDTAEANLDERLANLRRLAKFGTRRDGSGVNVYAGIPTTERQLPYVCFQFSGTASEAEAMVADSVHTVDVEIGAKLYRQETKGSYKRRNVQVTVLAESYDDTWTLHRAVADVFERARGRLWNYGVQDLRITATPPETERTLEEVRILEGQLDINFMWLYRTTELYGPMSRWVTFVNTGEPE